MHGVIQKDSETIRIGVIDCGTQSITLLVAQKSKSNADKADVAFLHRESLDLASWKELSSDNHVLSQQGINNILGAVKTLNESAKKWQVSECWFLATHALRCATNRHDVLSAVKQLGLRTRLIDPLQEAKLSYIGAKTGLHELKRVGVFDLGAGSLEVAAIHRTAKGNKLVTGSSFLGAFSVYQKGLISGLSDEEKTRKIEQIKEELEQLPRLNLPLVGTGGTLFALVGLTQKMQEQGVADLQKQTDNLHGFVLDLLSLKKLISAMEKPSFFKADMPDWISSDRKKILYSGAWVVYLLMEKEGVSSIVISCYGLCQGFAKKYLDILTSTSKRRRVRHHVNPMSSALLQIGQQAFTHHYNELEIELGCADAKFLFDRARQNSNTMHVGLEIRKEMVDRVNRQASKEQLQNITAIFCNINQDISAIFHPQSVQRAHVLFPDPWFKKDQHKRRLVQPELAKVLVDILKDSGELFFQSDIYELALDAMAVFESVPTLKNVAGEWSFIKQNPYNAASLREVRVLEQGGLVWRILYRKILEEKNF